MSDNHEHHILSDKMAVGVFVALLIMTVITVVAAQFDFGPFNFFVAMLIATIKALLVVLFFMALLYDSNDNRVIFGISFIFVVIFVVLTSVDLFFREGHKQMTPKDAIAGMMPESGPQIKLARFWESRPETVNRGKELFAQNCASCHGNAGAGDGPAAAGLNPKPRNFTDGSGWKAGRKPTEIYATLLNAEGLVGMPVFSTLPPDDLFSLAHYVVSLGPPAKDSEADLKEAGLDTSLDDGGLGGGGPKRLPTDFAIELIAEEG